MAQAARKIDTAHESHYEFERGFPVFRIYGPENAAFDGRWKPGDFKEVETNKIRSG